MTEPLDLAPFMIRRGDRVIASRVEGERARRAHAAAAHRRFLADPLMQGARS